MIGICAGLALKGCQPFAYTIATFSLYRPFEMVRDDLCYQNLPVTVVGMGAGVIYSTLGGTHHTQEDIAVAGAIPNMQIIAPCDPLECTEATRWCAQQKNGPVYLRIGKAGEPVLTNGAEPWQFGKIRYLRRGTDVCILTYGVITKMAAAIADRLAGEGKVGVAGLSAHHEAARSRRHHRRAEARTSRSSSSRSMRRKADSHRRPSRSLGTSRRPAGSTRSPCRMRSSTIMAPTTTCLPRMVSLPNASLRPWHRRTRAQLRSWRSSSPAPAVLVAPTSSRRCSHAGIGSRPLSDAPVVGSIWRSIEIPG